MKLSIVVPLLNERESLPELTDKISAAVTPLTDTWEVLFIDDGSTDGSFDVLREIHSRFPGHIRMLRFDRNYGKAAALSTGFAEATGDIIITMDADLQDDPAAIPDMVKKIEEGFDLVSGWKKVRHDPVLSKNMPSKLFNFTVSMLVGLRLHDYNCGFKAYRAAAAKNLDVYGERHRFLPALARWNNCRVTEIPVPHHARKYGKTKYGLDRFTNGLLDLVTLIFLQKYLRNPLHFFGVIGLLLELIGGGILAWFGIRWIIVREMHIRPLVLLALGSMIMGIQFISIGLLGEMIAHGTAKREYGIAERID